MKTFLFLIIVLVSGALAGLIHGARMELADALNVDPNSISNNMVLNGINFLNDNFTIERIN